MPGVYISYPFCAQKCSFCNFASGVYPRRLEAEYVQAVTREIRGHEWRWTPETVYLGGGTPSLLDLPVLRALLQAVPGAPWREATLEAAPGSLTPERVAGWQAAGITRVSLGVQSFVKKEIRATGRKHDAAQVAADCALLRSHGIGDINIDLIAGLPHQTADSWAESLEWMERLAPPHVSVYLFEVDEDSRLGLEVLQHGRRYGARDVPGDDAMAELYERAVERLRAIGLPRYEVSNFARRGSESLHNLKYWRLEPYAGFGAGAHSFDGAERTANVEQAEEYVERMREGTTPRESCVKAEHSEEHLFVGLRLEAGIEPCQEEWVRFEEPIARFVSAGLLERDRTRLRLTDRGVLLSNEVLQEFVTA